jgi:hypothetical protein
MQQLPTINTGNTELATLRPDGALSSQEAFQALAAETQADLHPALENLRQILDRPHLHTIGDLAALTDRLTNEMMLFNALVGGPLAQNRSDNAETAPVDIDFLADFLRSLNAKD